MDKGLVSIIVPVFNRPLLVQEAIASALAQTYRPIEIIIVDDDSTDSTPAVVASLATIHAEIRPLRRKNGGPGAARETGRLAARGEFIQYLDSDDLLLPRKLELQVSALRDNPDSGVAYGRTKYLDEQGREIECTWKDPDRRVETMFPSMLIERWWETATPLYRSSVSDRVGAWLPTRLEEDWEYDSRVAATGTRLVFVPQFVAIHRHHAGVRLSLGPPADARRLRDRALAHCLIAQHAVRAQIGFGSPEARHFSRDAFHLARQCAAAGLDAEASDLIKAAASLYNPIDMRAFGFVAKLVGWKALGKLSMLRDRGRALESEAGASRVPSDRLRSS